MARPDKNEFDRIAGERRTGLISEFLSFLAHSKKWWLLPILIAILLVSLLVVLAGTGAAPFIYTLF